MNKLETKLSKKWINNLKDQCTRTGRKLRCIKIHGDQYQESGISDYILCFSGQLVVIEFKVYPNHPTPLQLEFLNSILKSGGWTFIITFMKMYGVKNQEQELDIITRPSRDFVRSVGWYYQ